NAAIRKVCERAQVRGPFSLRIEHGLMPALPKLLDHRPECRPIMGLELTRVDEGHATPMHPKTDGHTAIGISCRQSYMAEVRHERLASGQYLLGLLVHVHREPDVSTQFVRQNIERS